jgi:predicted RNase H-like HicB family nuclease
MKRNFTASVQREGEWFVAQCIEVDIASQGKTEEEALLNLQEAIELYFEPPRQHIVPNLRTLVVDLNEAVAVP